MSNRTSEDVKKLEPMYVHFLMGIKWYSHVTKTSWMFYKMLSIEFKQQFYSIHPAIPLPGMYLKRAKNLCSHKYLYMFIHNRKHKKPNCPSTDRHSTASFFQDPPAGHTMKSSGMTNTPSSQAMFRNVSRLISWRTTMLCLLI